MPFVNPDPTYLDQANRVQKLHEGYYDVRNALKKKDPDARNVNLNNMCMATNAAMATLRLLHHAAEGGAAAFFAALGLKDPAHLEFVKHDLLRSGRLFLLLECQFQTEGLFRSILTALGEDRTRQGFFGIAKTVLAETDIPDSGKKLRILQVPLLMRNSMHSNGIHNGYKGNSTAEVIDGVEFKFDNGKKVECGSWFHIVIALTASLAVLAEIVKSPKVTALEIIPENYAVQKKAEGAQGAG